METKVVWNFNRYNWVKLRADGSAGEIPQAIESLRIASNHREAERAYWRIDNTIVVQGALFEAALPSVECLLGALLRCTRDARPYILELLVQIGSGEPSPSELELGNSGLGSLCKQELSRGEAVYFDLLENGTDEERAHCIDLLGICCGLDASVKDRFQWYLDRLLAQSIPDGLQRLAKNWIAELER